MACLDLWFICAESRRAFFILDHLRSKHNGAQFFAMRSLGKSPPPPWTVPRYFWHAAHRWDVSRVVVVVKLFHEARCRLIRKYRIYGDPLPHPALRGKVLRQLIRFVTRAMAIAQLTYLHIAIPSSETISEPVPSEYFLEVSFAWDVSIIDSSPLRLWTLTWTLPSWTIYKLPYPPMCCFRVVTPLRT